MTTSVKDEEEATDTGRRECEALAKADKLQWKVLDNKKLRKAGKAEDRADEKIDEAVSTCD
jgi:hypothetical protein